MKKPILYLFVFIYASVILRPVMPYVTDMVAHILFFKDHMLTMHAHNGKFHVHTEISDAVKSDMPEKNTGTAKKESPCNEDIIIHQWYIFSVNHTSLEWITALSIATQKISIDLDIPPPRG